ncbi:protein sel-1 homolog 3 [Aplochiton taeniatus]
MKVSHIKQCGYAIAALLLSLGQCMTHSTPTSSLLTTGEGLDDNFIEFDSAPDLVLDGSVVNVFYGCSRACELGVEVVVSTPIRSGVTTFRKRWTNRRPFQAPTSRPVRLRLLPALAYRRDFFNRHFLEAQEVLLRAWLSHLDDCSETGTHYNSSLARTWKVLRTLPASERPARPSTACPSWSAELTWLLTRDRVHQCPHEPDTVDMLTFPFVSTGERFGVVRKLQPFLNRDLERARLQTVNHTRNILSVWVYLLERCDKGMCSIIHHVDGHTKYTSPLIQLTDTGDVIIQMRLATGEDEAFKSNLALPLRTWIRLDFSVEGSKVSLEMTPADVSGGHGGKTLSTFQFQDNIHYNDTDGYFVIGGGKHIPGIFGYFGPIKNYRFGTQKVENPLLSEKALADLEQTHLTCEEIKEQTVAFLQALTDSPLIPKSDRCHARYLGRWDTLEQTTCRHTWSWEAQIKHSTLFRFLQTQQENLYQGIRTKHLGRELYDFVVSEMFDGLQIQPSPAMVDLLKACSCFGHPRASLLLATMHFAGLGVPVDQQQGHVYSLIGAVADDRLALMHLGYKHTQGTDGFLKDFDMAYGYYSNVGVQSAIDQGKILENQQLPTELIRLNNEDDLGRVTPETSDQFQFLHYQAESGDLESQKHLARILFWGQNGVSKDVVSAVRWFKKSAMQMKDPSAMYDYSILLVKGQGVERNLTLGFQLLQKAAEMGSVQALNGLGWYHCVKLKDHKTAMKYFEQAAHNGSDNGMYNLGVYYITGKNPDDPAKNETAAFWHFLNAAVAGHVDAAVEAGWYLSTGRLAGVAQDARRAVIILKQVCERNGHLGFLLREALQDYLQGMWGEALVKYVLLAETGLGVAQNNAAHLWGELEPGMDYHWRYHNHSTFNEAPHASGLLTMGDYYYRRGSSGVGDRPSLVSQAASLYSRAALAGSPQGLFNLAVLAEEGHVFPRSVSAQLDVSPHAGLDAVVEELLQRCLAFEDEDNVTPCSLALLRVQIGKAWRKMTQNFAQLTLAYASLGSVISALLILLIHCLLGAVDRSGTQGDAARREHVSSRAVTAARVPWLSRLRAKQRLHRASDWAVTAAGVFLCALCLTVSCHLL